MTTSTIAETNKRLIEDAYAAFARGDIPAVFGAFDEKILWHIPGRGPISGDYRGHEEVLGFFERFMGLSGGTFWIRIDEMLASDHRVLVLVTESAEREWVVPSGARLDHSEREGHGFLAMPGGSADRGRVLVLI
jgi:ketosteroid isomerase-like protein